VNTLRLTSSSGQTLVAYRLVGIPLIEGDAVEFRHVVRGIERTFLGVYDAKGLEQRDFTGQTDESLELTLREDEVKAVLPDVEVARLIAWLRWTELAAVAPSGPRSRPSALAG
jgi:hypothetical protein